MGSSSSKVARGAARKYPTRAPSSAVTSAPTPRPRVRPDQGARKVESKAAGDGSKDEGIYALSFIALAFFYTNANFLFPAAIRADAMDPDFAPGGFSQRLQSMGIVEPNPTYSPSSTANPQLGPSAPLGPMYPPARTNPTLTALEARQRLQREAEENLEAMGRSGNEGRRFLDMRTVVDAIKLRDHGVPQQEIESRLRIQPGLLSRFGRPDILKHVSPN